MKCFAAVVAIIVFFTSSSRVRAEVAVRHMTTSENEFQALALALGYTPVSEILTEKSAHANELAELFRTRLIDAQAEWLKRGGTSYSGAAMNRLLELALKADWSKSERQTFVTFYIRKIESEPASQRDSFARLSTFVLDDESVDLSAMSANTKEKWHVLREFEKTQPASLPSNLPSDVTMILLNGRPFTRQSLLALSAPRSPMRVTFVSNTYQPATIAFNGNEAEWPQLSRRPWINDDCSINPLPVSYGNMQIKALGFATCSETQATQTDRVVADAIENFGITRGSPLAPIGIPGPPETSLRSKPWFWGALGVITLGAVIAVRANGRNSDAAIQPTHQEGW